MMILIIMAMIMMTEKKRNGKGEIKSGPNVHKWLYFKFILILILENSEVTAISRSYLSYQL